MCLFCNLPGPTLNSPSLAARSHRQPSLTVLSLVFQPDVQGLLPLCGLVFEPAGLPVQMDLRVRGSREDAAVCTLAVFPRACALAFPIFKRPNSSRPPRHPHLALPHVLSDFQGLPVKFLG